MPQTLRPGIPSAFRGNSDLRSAQCASHRADYFCGFSQLTTLKTRSAPPSHHARQRVAFLRQLYTLSALRGFSGLAWWTRTVLPERQLLSSSSYSGVRPWTEEINGQKWIREAHSLPGITIGAGRSRVPSAPSVLLQQVNCGLPPQQANCGLAGGPDLPGTRGVLGLRPSAATYRFRR